MNQRCLFDDLVVEPETSAPATKKKKPSVGWEFTDHSCRHCMGRVMRRVNPGGVVVVRCAECGASSVGEHDNLCWCGVEVRGHGSVFECFRNDQITMSSPQEVLVRERKIVKAPEKEAPRRSNPVRVEGYS